MKILKARFKTNEAFLDAFDHDLDHGGLFCPTTSALEEEEPVVVELHFPALPNKTLLRGNVVWWRSALPRLRVRAGALIALQEGERDTTSFILELAQGSQAPAAVKRKHPRIPVSVPIKWRRVNQTRNRDGRLRDISIGGALLLTDRELAKDEEIIVELISPGGARAMDISARVTHHGEEGVGIRFIYRDGGGSRRLREVVRRLVDGGP